MKKIILLISVLVSVCCCNPGLPDGKDILNSVDPFWGSGVTAAPLSEGMARGWNWEKAQSGNTSPAAVRPCGWASSCAFTGGYSSGYGRVGYSSCFDPPVMYGDTLKATGFTHFNHSGAGLMNRFYNYFLFTPSSEGYDVSEPSALVSEKASPGYYSAELKDYGVSFELTPARYAVCHRYDFKAGCGHLTINAGHCGLGTECFRKIRPYQQEERMDGCSIAMTGQGAWDGVLRVYGVDLYFSVRADGDITCSACTDSTIDISFAGNTAGTAIGFSLENASEASLRADEAIAAGFGNTLLAAREAWAGLLGRVRVSFRDSALQRRFYSALYQSLVKPSDYGSGFTDLATLWDMYRTQIPLLLSIYPESGERLAAYLLEAVERYGYCPIAHTMSMDLEMEERSGQASALGVYSICDAYQRGILSSEDYPRLKAALSKDLGFYSDVSGLSPSHTLDLSGAYRAAAFVAGGCSDKESAAIWRRGEGIWSTVYSPGDGLLVDDAVYYEGNRYNYSFRPHPGMNERVRLAGGPGRFCSMLDEFFCMGVNDTCWNPARDRIRRRDRFEGLNNESDMDSPYAYLWCGRPDRTAEVIDTVRRYRFTDGEGGCPGNNDSGSLSSWYVWNCLGIYPLTGTPYYLLATPSVDKAEIEFRDGILSISVDRESSSSIYPVSYFFNGREFREPWLAVQELEKGGTLVFRLADSPPDTPAPVPDWL